MTRYPKRTAYTDFNYLSYGPWRGLRVNTVSLSRDGYIQRPRTALPNALESRVTKAFVPLRNRIGTDSSWFPSAVVDQVTLVPYLDAANNRAYSKFVAAAHGITADLALTALDFDKSVAMVLSRGRQLLTAVNQLRKGDVFGMAKTLRVAATPETVKRYRIRNPGSKNPGYRLAPHKDRADLWLEYSFGWTPLLNDIYSASRVLGNKVPGIRIKKYGRSNFSLNLPLTTNSRNLTCAGYVGVMMAADLRVSNPNALLLSQLGLVNPAYVLWDAIPFSFVADWFLPVGRFLKSWTDFVGLEVINPVTTVHWIAIEQGTDKGYGEYTTNFTHVFTSRTLKAPAYRFPSVVQFKADLWKAVTSAALIIQKVSSAVRKLR